MAGYFLLRWKPFNDPMTRCADDPISPRPDGKSSDRWRVMSDETRAKSEEELTCYREEDF
jgi:hypothetical protein